MCFSATASFVAGTSLSVLEFAALKRAKIKSEIPVAIVPLLFGAQQLVEGIIWLSFRTEAPPRKTSDDLYLLWIFSRIMAVLHSVRDGSPRSSTLA